MNSELNKLAIKLKYPDSPPVFMIGTSGKGGVEALRFLTENIPAGFPASFFFLLHRLKRSPITKHRLLELLKPVSNLAIKIPITGEVVAISTIYLPTYGHHLMIKDNHIIHAEEPSEEHWRPSIDMLFKSGAKEYKKRAVSVLLTGGLEDGVKGLVETTYQEGVTIAQSPEDAYNPILPLNALLGDHPQYVLPLRDMPALFCDLAGYGCQPNQKSIVQKAAIAAAMKKEEIK
ncbi:chemotaxis protein CheB [Tunicatimonas pelagia]|uniref:chemotaxis protein CheB n=1 Tax=Tunicatimonas pelagia TaxID=931531 RepID=UPI0026666B36|nr:chemotaxis protein CheB [Tunicatimonas pelagia]WKN42175.1 chemotaxis protein CheB [Tunicatimonas pelagia]